MTPLIEEIYASGAAKDAAGKEYPLGNKIEQGECQHLHDLIKADPSVVRTLEVGLAHGLSALHICEALRGRKGAHHVILDPFQRDNFHGIGLSNLEKAGIDFHELIEKRSEFALPALAEERPGSFDFAFLDGWHTFDHTMVDAFYSLRLLRVGGYLALDDSDWDAIDKLVRYLEKYPCLELHSTWSVPGWKTVLKGWLRSPAIRWALPPRIKRSVQKRGRLVVFRKVAEDQRNWRWFAYF